MDKFAVVLVVRSKKSGKIKKSGKVKRKKYNRTCISPNSEAAIEQAKRQVARLKGLSTLDPDRIVRISVRKVESNVER